MSETTDLTDGPTARTTRRTTGDSAEPMTPGVLPPGSPHRRLGVELRRVRGGGRPSCSPHSPRSARSSSR